MQTRKIALILVQIQQYPRFWIIPTSGIRSRFMKWSIQLAIYYTCLLVFDFFPSLKPLITQFQRSLPLFCLLKSYWWYMIQHSYLWGLNWPPSSGIFPHLHLCSTYPLHHLLGPPILHFTNCSCTTLYLFFPTRLWSPWE